VILGVGGFLGSHLARHLLTAGWEVTGVLRHPRSPSLERRLGDILEDLRLVVGDASDPALLAPLLPSADAVFPFAGLSGAASSMQQPLADLEANGHGQLVVLETLRAHNPGAHVVFPGSRLQYGPCQRLPVDEDHPQRPVSIYGVHKMLGEQYCRLYSRAYGIPAATLRISNPYGPFQYRRDERYGIVGTFLARAARGQELRVYGGGQQLRDYIYIDDLVRLLAQVATSPAAAGQAFNASGPEAVTLREMAETVVATVGNGRVVDAPWPAEHGTVETGDYVGDTGRALRELGWRPKVGLAAGLAATWAELEPVLAASN
jgi:nucleoside-diphosphate-sugar epimerase